jgi:hypothetical protein
METVEPFTVSRVDWRDDRRTRSVHFRIHLPALQHQKSCYLLESYAASICRQSQLWPMWPDSLDTLLTSTVDPAST